MFTNKEVVIVGHGYSSINRGLGPEIDKYKRIVRLKPASWTIMQENPKDYGKRTDIMCSSWNTRHHAKQIPANEYWHFLDSRHILVKQIEILNELTLSTVLPHVCHKWTSTYVNMRTDNFKRNKAVVSSVYSDEKGHRHMSAGLYAIIYACEILKPKEINLIGFDNVTSGIFSHSLTRGTEWAQYPDHRWDIESMMLGKISEAYKVSIEPI